MASASGFFDNLKIGPRREASGPRSEKTRPKAKAAAGRRGPPKSEVVPLRTGWYRLVPDKFFSPRESAGEELPQK